MTRYFVEVKYRSSHAYGGPVGAITARKLRQMNFAARVFSATFPTNHNQRLVVALIDSVNEVSLLELD